MAIIVLGGLIRAISHIYYNGYLPQPYFYDPADTWMDWFNTADWARDAGVYDSWRTVYAPLSLVFLRTFGMSRCYEGGGLDSAYYARACDWPGVVMLHAIYALDIFLVARAYFKTDRSTALPRAIAIAMGLPLTAALERGNLIILCFTCVILAFGPIFKSARLRWLALGMAMNLKIYMIALLFPQLLRRRWRWFEGAAISAVFVYVVSYALLGRGSPLEIYTNIVAFQNQTSPNQFLDVFYQATFAPLIQLLNNQSFPVTSLIGSQNVETLLIVLPWLLRLTQLAIFCAVVGIWLRPEVMSMYRITNLGISFALITVESGGYTHLFPIFFTFFEKWKGFWPKVAIICCYALSFQFDYILDRTPPLVHDSFFNNSTIFVTYYIMLGSFIRPLFFYMIPFALSCATIIAVYRDIAAKGWQSRHRFRHDLPVFT
ncbi:MAG: hypothetical protein B7Y43_15975 [Sphingomonas sp. 28-62-20]|uniref:glycosyltransferase family 87 protein n=1 Tax=Sphingomonas sp. 28-62-20 TaxID=1970433 RepID=UPI000BCC8F87|nr:MAG: hypothetical protein B7Y43_15975 [Sphingomonas sp. 28-62-20]